MGVMSTFAGGRCYGYRTGTATAERVTVAEEAAVVRRIFQEYADGRSSEAIAKRLDAEGIRGPGRRTWGPSAIHGHVKRGTGRRGIWLRCLVLPAPRIGLGSAKSHWLRGRAASGTCSCRAGRRRRKANSVLKSWVAEVRKHCEANAAQYKPGEQPA